MRASLLVASALVCVVAVALTTLVFDWSFTKAAALAPVLVFSFGALAGLAVFWTRIALDPLIRRRRARKGEPTRTPA